MKKIFYQMMALAVTAFTFTACEDVPEPYTNPYNQHQVNPEEVAPEPAGTGTLAEPYNVAGVLNYINTLGADVTSTQEVYIKGIVISIKEQFASQYGNVTCDISDTEGGVNKFTVYRALYLGNKKWADGDKTLKEGDEVIVCGKVVNYKGTTPETAQGTAYIYSINGEGGSTTPPTSETIGTKDAPVDVARALTDIDKLEDGGTTKEFYYIKGKVKTIKTKAEDIAKYKNIDYIITDNGNNELTVFRGKNLDNTDFTEAGQINVGDEVVVYGQLTKYKNANTGAVVPEVAQGNYIVKLTAGGDTPNPPAGEPAGTGTLAEPYNVAGVLNYINTLGADVASPQEVYIKGIVISIKEQFASQYGNVTCDISDTEGGVNKFTVYRALYLGNKKWADGDKTLKEGDEVIVCGKVVNYKGTTPETAQGTAYIYSINGEGGSDTPPAGDKGTAENPYTVTEAIAANAGTGVYVKGFIVGNITGQVLADGAHFDTTGDTQTNLIIAASADETDVAKCMPVQLPSGAVRTALNLKDNPGNYKKEVTLYGNIEKYFGAPGIKSVSFAILEGREIGTNPGGGGSTPDTPAGDVKKVTVAEFNDAAESTDVWYQLTGTVSNLKDGDQYGNFDLVDETGSVYVYGLLSEKGGAKKLFQELVAAKGIANGKKITIIGTRGSYNGKIEVMNAYFVSIE